MSRSCALDAELGAHWQLWLLLRHLLPVRSQRTVILEAIRYVASTEISIDTLFEELLEGEAPWGEVWGLRARPGTHQEGLQGWVRNILWQNDDVTGVHSADSNARAAFLAELTSLSQADFGWIGHGDPISAKRRGQAHDSLNIYLAAFRAAGNASSLPDTAKFWASVTEACEGLPFFARCGVTKHLADLCADSDQWVLAGEGYALVETILRSGDWDQEQTLRDTWRTINHQCRAAAEYTTGSHSRGAKLLASAVDAVGLRSDVLAAMNFGADAGLDWSFDDVERYRERRTPCLRAPLTIDSHDASAALGYWLAEKHEDATRRFWAVLRRQVSLGSIGEARRTKGWYARCLLERAGADLESREIRGNFEMAVRLLLESENPHNVKRVAWSAQLVGGMVNSALLERVILDATRYEGARMARILVTIELFEAWIVKLAPQDTQLATRMWSIIAEWTKEYPGTFESRTDIGRRGLDALKRLALARPELARDSAARVADTVCAKITQGHWGRLDAMETALVYVSIFESGQLRRVVDSVVALLEAEDPTENREHISDAALRLLVHPESARRLGEAGAIFLRVREQILRYGLARGEGSEMLVLYHLADFDPKAFSDETVRDQLREPIKQIRRRARAFNSSSVVDNIRGLLIVPDVAGADGVEDALAGLIDMLDPKNSERSIALANIAGPLLELARSMKAVRAVFHDDPARLTRLLGQLVESLSAFWHRVALDERLLAPFSLPPRTKAHPVVVHNVAYASITLGLELGEMKVLGAALDSAAQKSSLRGPIVLARETSIAEGRLQPGHSDSFALPVEVEDDPHLFYQALGRRLALLERLDNDGARAMTAKLLQACVRLGPRSGDVAVLMLAKRLSAAGAVSEPEFANYLRRVDRSPEMRLLLLPLLELLRPGSPADAKAEGR